MVDTVTVSVNQRHEEVLGEFLEIFKTNLDLRPEEMTAVIGNFLGRIENFVVGGSTMSLEQFIAVLEENRDIGRTESNAPQRLN